MLHYKSILPIFIAIFFIPNFAHAQNRIVSLKPNITEIVYALGAGDEIVGDTTFCDSPPDAKKKEKVGDYVHADVEKIIRLQPTIILNSQENSNAREIEFLEKQGLKVRLFAFGRMDDIAQSILEIGKVLGREAEAQNLLQKYQKEMDEIKNQAGKLASEKILFVVDQKPLVVVGSQNWINDLIAWLGLNSVSASNPLRYPHYNLEQVVNSHPTLIINMSMGSENQKKELDEWVQFPVIKDARKVPFDIGILRANHRLPEAGRKLIEVLKKSE